MLALAAVLAGCGGARAVSATGRPGLTAAQTAPTATASSQSDGATPGPGPTKPVVVPHLSPPAVAGLHWVAVGASPVQAPYVYVAQTAGGEIGLLWMDASRLRFRYVPGYKIPEAGPVLAADHRPSTWGPRMVAAFNGGFRLADGAGGYFYAGQTVRPLESGRAAFQIFRNGTLKVGVWGSDLSLTTDTVVVRENLRPLVADYQSQASSSDAPDAWGQANGGFPHANRTALGQLSDGALVFAYGYELPAVDMADVMVRLHVRTAVMLDMNKSWPTGFVYQHIGGSLVGHRILSQIWRDPSTYYHQFSKDFVVAMLP